MKSYSKTQKIIVYTNYYVVKMRENSCTLYASCFTL